MKVSLQLNDLMTRFNGSVPPAQAISPTPVPTTSFLARLLFARDHPQFRSQLEPWMPSSFSTLVSQSEGFFTIREFHIDNTGETTDHVRIYEPEPSLAQIAEEFRPDMEAAFVLGRTISNKVVGLSASGHLALFMNSQDEELEPGETEEAVYQKTFKGLNAKTSQMECPFMCPLTGCIGAVGSNGDIFVWQQK